jgi:CRISPR-associated protein Csb2
MILASETEPRTAPISYVPPNDAKTGRLGDASVLPVYRRRQPRRFPASRPHDPIVRFYWEATSPDDGTFAILARLAADTAYVGHSASLTRCRFLRSDTIPLAEFQSPARRIYEGRLAELSHDYERFVRSGGKVGRPHHGDRVAPRANTANKTIGSYFSPEWLVLEHTDGEMPDIRAAALLSKEIRDALLSGYRQSNIGDCIPSEVSGHTREGSPAQTVHLAIVPLAFAAYPFADGHMLGFALVPPRDSKLFGDRDFLQAMRKIAPLEAERRKLRLHRFDLRLSPTFTPSKRSLDSAEYTRKAFTFATVTPIVLDRHLKKTGSERQDEVITQIKSACVNIGLPEPYAVIPDKHSAIEGAPSAQPSGNAPEWMRWRLPASLAGRLLTHATIQFSCPVEGPVILGAGRFVGLGLCRPIDMETRS